MLEHGKKISKDLSEFLKLYLTGDDLKNVSDDFNDKGYNVSVSLLRMVISRTNNVTQKNNMKAIEKLIYIASKKRVETNPVFTRVLREHSDIINRYKTK